MDYKEKYEQALERAKVINPGTADYEVAVKIFPELKQSKDERIRKALLNEFIHLQSKGYKFAGLEGEEIIVWLEKQKDHEDELDKAYKTADEVQYRRGYEAAKREFEKQGEMKPQGNSALEVWKDMRLEVYQQASGNRHEPNYSDDSTKMFSLTDIDEIFEKVAEKQGEQKFAPDWMPKFLDELRSKKNYFDWDEHKDIEGGILAIIQWMNPNYFIGKDGEQKSDKVEPKFCFQNMILRSLETSTNTYTC